MYTLEARTCAYTHFSDRVAGGRSFSCSTPLAKLVSVLSIEPVLDLSPNVALLGALDALPPRELLLVSPDPPSFPPSKENAVFACELESGENGPSCRLVCSSEGD